MHTFKVFERGLQSTVELEYNKNHIKTNKRAIIPRVLCCKERNVKKWVSTCVGVYVQIVDINAFLS